MRPPEEEIRLLVYEWLKKADLDFRTVVRLSAESEFRDIVGFHAQQAAEKYLKAVLTRHQTEFPETHVIRRLLILLQPVDPAMAKALDDANWLSPFGAEIAIPAIGLKRCQAKKYGSTTCSESPRSGDGCARPLPCGRLNFSWDVMIASRSARTCAGNRCNGRR